MLRVKIILLALIGLITGGGAVYLYARLGNDVAAPALLGALIALTCVLRILTLRR